MPSYEYKVKVDLDSDDEVREVLTAIHLSVCGGETKLNEDGTVSHTCARAWYVEACEFRPVPLVLESEPTVVWDEEGIEDLNG